MYYRPSLHKRLAGFRNYVEAQDRRRLLRWVATALAVSMTLIICSAYLPTRFQFEAGDPAPRTFAASRSLAFEDEEGTEALRAVAVARAEPIYRWDPGTLVDVTGEIRSLFGEVRRLRQVSPEVEPTSEDLATLRGVAAPAIPDDVLRYLLQTDSGLVDQVEQEALSSLRLVYNNSITEELLPEQRGQLSAIVASLSLPEVVQRAVTEIASAHLRSNTVLDEVATEASRQEAAAGVEPVQISVSKGETIAQAGEPLTRQQVLVLGKMGMAGTRADWRVWLGVLIVVLLELMVLGMLLRRFGASILADNNLLLGGATLLLLFTAVSRLLAVPPLSPFLVPIAAAGLVGSVVLGARASSVLVAVCALNLGIMTRLQLEYAAVALLSGLCAVYLVSHLMERSELLSAGLWTTLFTVVAVFGADLLTEAPLLEALEFTLWGMGSGVLSLVVGITLLQAFEVAFDLTTPLRLLELGNPAQPLLRRLMQEAPGTYNHSVMVGNLAEAAAEAVGADPLLTRVGAYYHDIGKISRPEYFIENQLHIHNPHDKLSPSLSKLAITAHVGDGVELARANGLPKPVVDIIQQHHGTSVLSYFFYKARQDARAEVPEENYRYEAEKPASREAAIIMLADSVEAASKAMQHPTMKKLQIVIRDIIRQKMEDGQLDNCPLTFGDLHKIAEAFEVALRGAVGHRIEYPSERGSVGAVPTVTVPGRESVGSRVSGGGAQGAVGAE